MPLFRWLRSRRSPKSQAVGKIRHPRPNFDLLEDRLAPATLIVNSRLDNTTSDSALTLREAIAIVNSQSTAGRSAQEIAQVTGTLGSSDTIRFDSSLGSSTIFLSGTRLDLTKSVIITGPGANLLTLNAQDGRQIFFVDGATSPAIAVTVEGVRLRDGNANNSPASFNTARGGAIFNEQGNLTVRGCYFLSNAATHGGALYNNNGTTTIIDSTFEQNSTTGNGAAVVNNLGTTSLIQCTVTGNTAGGNVGALFNFDGTLNVRQSTIVSNTAATSAGGGAGGLFTNGQTTVTNTTTVENSIFLDNTLAGSPGEVSQGTPATVTGGNNYFGSNTASSAFVNGSNGNIVSSTPATFSNVLAPLALNGGTVSNYLPAIGSPVLNAGSNARIPAGVTTDQRGSARVWTGNTVDIGATERAVGPATLIVDSSSDIVDGNTAAGQLSLREAILIANDRAGADAITFAAALSGQTLTLTRGRLNITGSLTISGPGANNLSISGNNASQIFFIDGQTVGTVIVTIQDVTLTQGRAAGGGAVLDAFDSGGYGGALLNNRANLTLTRVAVTNSVVPNGNGGGLYNWTGGGNMTLISCTVSGNSSQPGWGAGGGLFNWDSTLTIVNSTISGNSATESGGGLFNQNGTLTVINTTFTDNRADSDGNGSGEGGGLAAHGAETLNNSIVAGDFKGVGTNPDDIAGTIETANNNLIGAFATRGGIVHGASGNIVGNAGSGTLAIASILGPLQDNGGPTKTHALVAGSPAINAGSNALAVDGSNAALTTDQRGQPRIVGTNVDIGAYERPLSTGSAIIPNMWKTYLPSDAFTLNSKPGSNRIIYLDFDGHTVSGTGWNTDFNGGADFTIPAWSMDGNRAAFSDTEKNKIIELWRMIAEDWAPFDINVTTQDPGLDALRFTGGADTTWGTRAIIGPDPRNFVSNSPQTWPAGGGVADQNVFKSSNEVRSFSWNGDSTSDPEITLPVTVSHEVGHTFNLEHDGTISPADEYYGGHGSGVTSWGPIMGEPDRMSLTQWSRNTYPSADRAEDDLAIITGGSNGVTYRTDDHGNDRPSATSLPTNDSAYGVIEKNTDLDFFSFTANASTTVTIQVDPLTNFTANLDVQARLFNSAGTLLQTVNPDGTLNATITFNVTTTGTYFVEVDGIGRAPENTTGYPDYGSLGNYRVTISGNTTPPFTGPLVVSTSSDIVDANFSAGNLSLREAIQIANSRAGADTITFTVSNVTLENGELLLTDTAKTTIVGNGVTIARSSAIGIPEFRLLNIAGGASAELTGITFTNGKLSAGDGGAILNSGTLTVANSTFLTNSARFGGAIYNAGTLTIVNSTLSANLASESGGGVASTSTLSIVSSTLTGNRGVQNGGGFLIETSGATILKNTIVAGNFRGSTGTTADDINRNAGAITATNNLIGDTATAGGIGHNASGNIVGNNGTGTIPIAQILDPLANNGGPTLTHALVQNSLAIARASLDSVAYDQRDAARDPGAADIGAYEVQHPLSAVGAPSTHAATFQPKPSASPNEAFVKGLYQLTLLRSPAPVEVDGWLAIINGGQSRESVAFGFVNSVENRINQVTFYYKYFLGRLPDQAGLNGWVNILQAGADEGAVMSGFLLSTEFTGQNDDASFVNLMYYAILGRQAEPAGFAGWTSLLGSGQMTRAQVGNGFLRSTESITRVVVSNFTNYLKRTITGDQAAPYVAQISQGKTFGKVAADLLGSAEFFIAAGQNLT